MLSFNDDLTDELHLKLSDLLSVNYFAFAVLGKDRRCDLHESRHAPNVRILDVVHDTEEAFELVDFSTCLYIARVVALAHYLDVLANQGHSIELNSGHHLFGLLLEEELDSDSVLCWRVTPADLLICIYY